MPQSKSGDVSIKVTLDTSAAKREAARLQEELSKVRQTASRAREARESQEYKPLTNRSQQPSPNQIPVSGGGATGGGGGAAGMGGAGTGGGIGPSTSYQSPSPNGLNQVVGVLALIKLMQLPQNIWNAEKATRDDAFTRSVFSESNNYRFWKNLSSTYANALPGVSALKSGIEGTLGLAEYASSFTPGMAAEAKGTWKEGPARALNTVLRDTVEKTNLWAAKVDAYNFKLDEQDKYIDATIRLAGRIPGMQDAETYGETMYSIAKRQNLFDKMIKHADATNRRLAKEDFDERVIQGSASR